MIYWYLIVITTQLMFVSLHLIVVVLLKLEINTAVTRQLFYYKCNFLYLFHLITICKVVICRIIIIILFWSVQESIISICRHFTEETWSMSTDEAWQENMEYHKTKVFIIAYCILIVWLLYWVSQSFTKSVNWGTRLIRHQLDSITSRWFSLDKYCVKQDGCLEMCLYCSQACQAWVLTQYIRTIGG